MNDVDASTMAHLIDQTTMSGYNRMDVAFDLAGDAVSFTVAMRSLHRGGTIFELGTRHHYTAAEGPATPPPSLSMSLPLAELVSRSITLRTVTGGSVSLLRQLVDVVSVQCVSVEVNASEYFEIGNFRLAIEHYQRRLATGPVIFKYD